MTASLDKYLKLRAELARVRWVHAGLESLEEDALLDTMDEVWATLSEAELAELERRPPPRHLIRSNVRRVPGQLVRIDTDVFACGSMAPRRLAEVA